MYFQENYTYFMLLLSEKFTQLLTVSGLRLALSFITNYEILCLAVDIHPYKKFACIDVCLFRENR
jgi:hypothetical protein